jgi:hypothetical protein
LKAAIEKFGDVSAVVSNACASIASMVGQPGEGFLLDSTFAVCLGVSRLLCWWGQHLSENRREGMRAGVLPPLIACLRAQDDTLATQLWAMRAIAYLAGEPDNRRAVLQAGTIKEVKSAIELFADAPDIMFEAVRVIGFLAGEPMNRVDVVDAGCVASLLAVAELYPNDAGIQMECCTAIFNMAGEPSASRLRFVL